MSIRYIELADYLAIAAEITGLDPATLTRVTKLGLAESALHAPSAGFGETEFYPDFIDKAAVLIVDLAKNHPPARWQQARSLGSTTPIHRDQRLDMAHHTIHRRRRASSTRNRRRYLEPRRHEHTATTPPHTNPTDLTIGPARRHCSGSTATRVATDWQRILGPAATDLQRTNQRTRTNSYDPAPHKARIY